MSTTKIEELVEPIDKQEQIRVLREFNKCLDELHNIILQWKSDSAVDHAPI